MTEFELGEKIDDKREKWLNKYGFNNELNTYVYFLNDSYQKKEELKKAGFRFTKELFWHCATVPQGYERKVFELSLNEVGQMMAWGSGQFNANAMEYVKQAMKAHRPVKVSNSQWFGEVGDRIRKVKAKIVDIRIINTMWGGTQLVTFDLDGNIAKWFTDVYIMFRKGNNVLLSGTVKSHIEDQYADGEKVTVLTRCLLKPLQ